MGDWRGVSSLYFTVSSHKAYVGQSHEKPREKQSVCQQMAKPAFILKSQKVKEIRRKQCLKPGIGCECCHVGDRNRGHSRMQPCTPSLLHFLRISPGATFSWLAFSATDHAFPVPCSELLDVKVPMP